MLQQTFLANFQILLHPYSCLQQNNKYIRYNNNIDQVLYNMNKNNIDDKFIQETMYNLYYIHNDGLFLVNDMQMPTSTLPQ